MLNNKMLDVFALILHLAGIEFDTLMREKSISHSKKHPVKRWTIE
jgi:hypothetical protein